MHCHLLFCESDEEAGGGETEGQPREAGPPVQSNGGLCGRREYKL